MNDLFAAHPPPRECEVLWFETPSVMNPPEMSVAAYSRLGPPSDSYGSEEACAWPAASDDDALAAWAIELPELDALLASVGWSCGESGEDNDDSDVKRMNKALSISYAFALLLIQNGLPKIDLDRYFSHPSGVSIILGFQSGGVMPIGQLRARKWSPIRRARPAPIELESLSPESRMVLAIHQPKRFVALGGDLNERDAEGRTPLFAAIYPELREVRAMLDAGADARVRLPDGTSVLHRFRACEIPILQLLIKHGADPHAVDNKGEPITTELVWDGRCTVQHLRFYEKHGVRLPPPDSRMSFAMSRIALCPIIRPGKVQQLRALLKYLIGLGHDINACDAGGRTPIWLALEEHAKYLETFHARVDSYGHDCCAGLLLEFGANPLTTHPAGRPPFIPSGASPLMVRRYDDVRLIKTLLQHGADPHARCAAGMTALDYAKLAIAEPQTFATKGAAKCAAMLERAMQASSPTASKRRKTL